MLSNEEQSLVVNPPEGQPATEDPVITDTQVEDNVDGLTAIDQSGDSDESTTDMLEAIGEIRVINQQLEKGASDVGDLLTRTAALEALHEALETISGVVPITTQIAMETILQLTTRDTGWGSESVIPSLEDYANPTISCEAIAAYASKLKEGISRLLKRLAELFEKLMYHVTGSVPNARRGIALVRAKLAIAKGGEVTDHRTPSGRYSQFLEVRGMPVTSGWQLHDNLRDIDALVTAITTSHLVAISGIADELIRIVNAPSFPNTGATRAQIANRLGTAVQTQLGALCNKPIATDPRFRNPEFSVTASPNLLGNRTVYLQQPRPGGGLQGNIGVVQYFLDDTRQGGFGEPKQSTVETFDLKTIDQLLTDCDKLLGKIEQLDRGNLTKRITQQADQLRKNIDRRLDQGDISSNLSTVLLTTANSFADLCANPTTKVLELALQAVRATTGICSACLTNYD